MAHPLTKAAALVTDNPRASKVNDRFAALPASAFVRLRALLDGRPAAMAAIDMTIGEPRHPFPPFVTDVLAENSADYGRYPPPGGSDDLRAAIADWLGWRYDLGARALDPDANVVVVNGTREALFNSCMALCPLEKGRKQPIVAIPNPFYQCYAAGAAAAGAEALFWNATAETGHLPDLAALSQETWDRIAVVFMCSPANPQGAAADRAYWSKLLELCRTHNAVLLADECYSELYYDAPPTGVLEAAGGDFTNLLVFNSLSKRSNLAGLRCGFIAGDPDLIARMWKLRSLGGAPVPLPVCAAGAAAYRDETHVIANRALYAEKFTHAEAKLGNRFGWRKPGGGMFLWLNSQIEWGVNGARAAQALWDLAGLRVLPGQYLARETESGNPGTDYIRIAMVHDMATTEDALLRLTSLDPSVFTKAR